MPNNLTAFNATQWKKQLIRKLDQINVMKRLVNTEYEGDLKQGGDTVRVRTLGSITMGPYTKGGTIVYQDLAPTVESFTVSDAQYFAFSVDDIDRAQNDISALEGYTQRAVVAMDNAVETKLLGMFSSAATSNQVTGAANAAITADSGTGTTGIYYLISKLAEALSNNNVPETGRWLKVHPAIRTLLMNDTAHFIRASEFGDEVVSSGRFDKNGVGTPANEAPGFIGQIQGFDVYLSAPRATDAGGNYILGGTRHAISYAAVISEMEALRLQATFGNAVRGLLLHDAKVFTECSRMLGYIKVTN